MKGLLKGFDFTLIITPILLAAFGVVMIYSASMVTAEINGLGSTYYLIKQLQWFVLALMGFLFFCFYPYKKIQQWTIPLVAISFLLLLAVIFLGDTEYNATRSMRILGFRIQPAEFVKLIIIIYLASVYAKKQNYIGDFKQAILPPLMLSLILVAFIIKQPDLGTAAITLAVIGVMVLSVGIKKKHIFIMTLSALAIGLMFRSSFVTETRIERFTGAFTPFADPDNSGYHLIQSFIAIGGGGWSGTGLGQSIQKLGFLWGAHTDFIMSIISEELGVFGVIFVVGSLALIVIRGLYISITCEDNLGSLMALGISMLIGIQAAVNLGASSGLLPITGVTLPFISYGGSSLLVTMVAMGILNNIARSTRLQEETITR